MEVNCVLNLQNIYALVCDIHIILKCIFIEILQWRGMKLDWERGYQNRRPQPRTILHTNWQDCLDPELTWTDQRTWTRQTWMLDGDTWRHQWACASGETRNQILQLHDTVQDPSWANLSSRHSWQPWQLLSCRLHLSRRGRILRGEEGFHLLHDTNGPALLHRVVDAWSLPLNTGSFHRNFDGRQESWQRLWYLFRQRDCVLDSWALTGAEVKCLKFMNWIKNILNWNPTSKPMSCTKILCFIVRIHQRRLARNFSRESSSTFYNYVAELEQLQLRHNLAMI